MPQGGGKDKNAKFSTQKLPLNVSKGFGSASKNKCHQEYYVLVWKFLNS